MCGIAGIIAKDGFTPHDIKTLSSKIRHRGPDDEGYILFSDSQTNPVICGGVDTPPDVYHANLNFSPKISIDNFSSTSLQIAFAHRRLSIIDLSPLGHQPMCSSDHRYWIIYNGEIYNYIEIRSELESFGIKFISHSDTEVILAAYQYWGDDCVNKFIGMWSFAIFNQQRQEVFFARDPFGIKPLYYILSESVFIFASEMSALLSYPGIKKSVNPQNIYDYVRDGLTNHNSQTMVEGIRQLPPAHYMKIDLSSLEIKDYFQYWCPSLKQNLDIGFNHAANQLKKLFIRSVDLHLRSDVPVGAALSGGIDSSAIVCAIRHLKPESIIHTFTYVADDAKLSEEKWADHVGKHIGAIMHKISATPDDLINDLDHLIQLQGEPFGSTSIYAQQKVFQKAKEIGIKVMLDGQGADEMLGGYFSFVTARLASLLRQQKIVEAYQFTQQASTWPGRNKKKIIVLALKHFLPLLLVPTMRKIGGEGLEKTGFNKKWLLKNKVSFVEKYNYTKTKDYLHTELHRSLGIKSIPTLLRYEDNNSMSHSIESRVPFLNTELVDFISSLPENYLIDQQGTTKAIFRQAMRGLVPDIILDRKDKIGFETPEKKWLVEMSDWVEITLSKAQNTPIFNEQIMQQEWQAILQGSRNFDWQIWRWLNFIRWVEMFEISDVFD